MQRQLRCVLATVFWLGLGAVPAVAVTLTVDSTIDAVDVAPGDGECATASGECTLRAAIQEANALVGADVLAVPAGRYALSVGPGFAVDEDAAAAGDLDLTDDVTITGAGVKQTVISGQRLDRVFHVLSPAVVEISGLTIRDGFTGFGAGVWNLGTLTLQRVAVSKNEAAYRDPNDPSSCSGDHAGIENLGTLVMVDSSIDHNRGCKTDFSRGGGLGNYGTATLTNVVVANNRAQSGGGIFNNGTLDLINVTMTRNAAVSSDVVSTAGMGGALMNGGVAHLRNTTVAYNHASNRPYNGGGGIDNRASQSALVTFTNSIVARNSRYDCSGNPSFTATDTPGFMVSHGHNLRGGGCPVLVPGLGQPPSGDLDAIDPRFGPSTKGVPSALSLRADSPAIDAGDDSACPATDGRGMARPQDGNGDGTAVCDIGAYEVAP